MSYVTFRHLYVILVFWKIIIFDKFIYRNYAKSTNSIIDTVKPLQDNQ